jgi:hypothetical protein
MSNKKNIKNRRLKGSPGGNIGTDAKGKAYRVVSPGGLTPGGNNVVVPIKRNLQGNYAGTCVGCLRPTDTGLAVRGPAEAQIAFLMVLGMTYDEAKGAAQESWRGAGHMARRPRRRAGR